MLLRNGDADLFSTISSATEISPVGLFTTPPAASFPSTLMVVPESCNAQRACEYDPATDDSHLKSMIDIELLTHPVASVRSRSLYIGSKNAVKVCAFIIVSNVNQSLSKPRLLPNYTRRSSRTSPVLQKLFSFQLSVHS